MLLMVLAEDAIQLVPDGTILIHIILILVMVAVLNRTLFRPVGEILDKRDRESRGKLDEAGELELQVSNGRRARKETLRAARASGYQLLEESRSEGMRERENEITRVRDEVNQTVQREFTITEWEARTAREAMDPASLAAAIRDRVLKPIRNGRGE
jgi:F-type H+-transporting ATPase subunit b